jgi:hypothetical protein
VAAVVAAAAAVVAAGCNVYGKGDDLDDCKRQFREAWATLRAHLTDADIALAFEMRRD